MMNTYDNGVILKYNVDENGSPVSRLITNEQQQVSPMTNLIQLTQIPDEHQRLSLWDEDGNRLHEVFDNDTVRDDNFKVTYYNGMVKLHPKHAGKTVTVSYYGRGIELISTNRIYHKSGNSTYEILQEVIDGAEEAMEVMNAMGGVTETIKKLDEKIIEGSNTVDRIENLVNELETYGYTILLSREAFVVKANEDGDVGKSEIQSVYSDVVVYKGGKQISPTLTIENENGCEFTIDKQRIKLTSIDINVIKANCDVVIDCGEGLVVKRTLEITKVFDGKVPYVVDMTNSIYGFDTYSDGEVVNEQKVVCQLTVTKADTDYEHYTVSVQNKPSGLDYRISGNEVEFTCRTGKFLPNNGSCLVVVTIDGKAYSKTFTWHKIKSGENAKSISVVGGQILKYNTHDYSDVPTPSRLTLTCNSVGLSGTYKWYAKHNGNYVLLENQSNKTLSILHDDVLIWNNQTETTIKCELDGYSDEISIVKLTNGQQGQNAFNVVLSNENHSVSIGNDGIVSDYEINQVWTIVYAYFGTEQVTPTIEVSNTNGCDVEVVGNRVNLLSLDNSFTTSTATLNVSYNNMSVNKVLTISKSKQGNDGNVGESASQYVLNVTEGTRSFTYSQINREPRPNVSATFIASLYENGNEIFDVDGVSYYWIGRGHLGGNSTSKTFTPTIKPTFDESVMSNDIVLTVGYNGQTITQVIPIAITKDADGLDWVQEWDSTKVEIKGNKLLAPKLFAGEYNSATDSVTGVAIGKDVIGEDGNVVGIVGYQNNKPTFILDTTGSVQLGQPFTEGESGFYYDGDQFIIKSNNISIGGVNVPTQDDVNNYVDGQIIGINDSLTALNDDLKKDISDVNQRITDFEFNFDSAVLDGVLDNIERAKLDAIFVSLEREVSDITVQYNNIYNNPVFINVAIKEQLKVAHDEYVSSFNELKVSYQNVINSTNVTPELVAIFNEKLDLFKTKSTEIAKMLNTSLISMSESITQTEINNAKNELQGEINDVSNAIGNLDSYVNGAFKEGIISINDVKALQERIVQLDKEYEDISARYVSLYNNNKLSEEKKRKLYQVADELATTHQQLKGELNRVVIDYVVTEQEMILINSITVNYSSKLSAFTKVCNECIEDIAKNNSQGIVDALDQEAIFNKLTNNGEVQGLYLQNGKLYINGEYIGANTIKAESIIGGIITSEDLSTGGKTVINGDNISTGTIKADLVKLSTKGQNILHQHIFDLTSPTIKASNSTSSGSHNGYFQTMVVPTNSTSSSCIEISPAKILLEKGKKYVFRCDVSVDVSGNYYLTNGLFDSAFSVYLEEFSGTSKSRQIKMLGVELSQLTPSHQTRFMAFTPSETMYGNLNFEVNFKHIGQETKFIYVNNMMLEESESSTPSSIVAPKFGAFELGDPNNPNIAMSQTGFYGNNASVILNSTNGDSVLYGTDGIYGHTDKEIGKDGRDFKLNKYGFSSRVEDSAYNDGRYSQGGINVGSNATTIDFSKSEGAYSYSSLSIGADFLKADIGNGSKDIALTEVGSFTPQVYGVTSGSNFTMNTPNCYGYYQVVGNVCYISLRAVWSSKGNATASDVLGIKGLPFSPKQSYQTLSVGLYHGLGLPNGCANIVSYTDSSGLKLYVNSSIAGSWGSYTLANVNNDASIVVTGWYICNK